MEEFKWVYRILSRHLRWILLLIGGLCLLVHIAHVRRFPEDVQLSEGVLLYLVSCLAVLLYVLYWLALTSIGMWLFRWPMECLRWISPKLPVHAPAYLPMDFRVMWAVPVWATALMSILLCFGFFRFQPRELLTYGSLIVLQGVLGGILLVMRRWLRFEKTGLRVAGHSTQGADDKLAARQGAYVLLGFWLLGPLLIGQNESAFVKTAFTIAQIRKPHAVVNVIAPWDTFLIKAGLVKKPSFLGPQYARFDDVVISHMSIGAHVIIEVPSVRGKLKQIAIPRGKIEVE